MNKGYYEHLRTSIDRILENLDTEEAAENDAKNGINTDYVESAIFHLQEARNDLLFSERKVNKYEDLETDICISCGAEHSYMSGPCEKCGKTMFGPKH